MFNAKIICEIGSNHIGHIEIGKKLINECKNIGCSAVKLQLWKADDLYKDTSIYELTKKLELNFDMAKSLFEYAKKINVDLFFSVFYPEAVDFCERIGVKYYKIAARSINDYKLLKYVADTNKPIFVSFSNEYKYDINRLINIFKGNQIIQMYTVSKYPPKSNDFDFDFLNRIIFGNGGYSNHYRDLYTCQLAIFLGALWIEAHVMLKNECRTSPDNVCSLTVEQLKELIDWQNRMKSLKDNIYAKR